MGVAGAFVDGSAVGRGSGSPVGGRVVDGADGRRVVGRREGRWVVGREDGSRVGPAFGVEVGVGSEGVAVVRSRGRSAGRDRTASAVRGVPGRAGRTWRSHAASPRA